MLKFWLGLSVLALSGCISTTELNGINGEVSDYPADHLQVKAPQNSGMNVESTGTTLLKTDGTIVAWGDVTDNENLDGNHSLHGPIALSDIGEIIFLSDNARLIAAIEAQNLPLLKDIDIAANGRRGVAISLDGGLYSWPEPPPNKVGNYIDVALGGNKKHDRYGEGHFVALDADGSVVVWGENRYWQLSAPKNLDKIVKVDAGDMHTIALTESGRVAVWGSNQGFSICISGCSFVPDAISVAALPEGLTKTYSAIDIAADGERNGVLLADGSVHMWGDSSYTQVFPPAERERQQLAINSDAGVIVRSGDVFTRLEAGGGDYYLPKAQTSLWDVANNGGYWQNSSGVNHWFGGSVPFFDETFFSEQLKTKLMSVSSGNKYAFGLTSDGQLLYEGFYFYSADGPPDTERFVEENISAYIGGYRGVILVKINGDVEHRMHPWFAQRSNLDAWEQSYQKQIINAPIKKLIVESFEYQVDIDDGYVIALLGDGSLVAWGPSVEAGEVELPVISEAVQDIRFYNGHPVALTVNGNLITWGEGASEAAEHFLTLPSIKRFASGIGAAISMDDQPVWLGGEWALPADLGPVIDVKDTENGAIVIQADGRIRAWGDITVTPAFYDLDLN